MLPITNEIEIEMILQSEKINMASLEDWNLIFPISIPIITILILEVDWRVWIIRLIWTEFCRRNRIRGVGFRLNCPEIKWNWGSSRRKLARSPLKTKFSSKIWRNCLKARTVPPRRKLTPFNSNCTRRTMKSGTSRVSWKPKRDKVRGWKAIWCGSKSSGATSKEKSAPIACDASKCREAVAEGNCFKTKTMIWGSRWTVWEDLLKNSRRNKAISRFSFEPRSTDRPKICPLK